MAFRVVGPPGKAGSRGRPTFISPSLHMSRKHVACMHDTPKLLEPCMPPKHWVSVKIRVLFTH
jgi:hypothetical protein